MELLERVGDIERDDGEGDEVQVARTAGMRGGGIFLPVSTAPPGRMRAVSWPMARKNESASMGIR